MLIYSSIEYSDNYSKTSGSLWQYCWDKPAVNNNGVIVGFTVDNISHSFNFKDKIARQTDINGTEDVEIIVPLKYLSYFWETHEMPLINCGIIPILTWSANCFWFVLLLQVIAVAISDAKLDVPVVKLLDQLKPAFERTINWNKYQSKISIQVRNQYLDYLNNWS